MRGAVEMLWHRCPGPASRHGSPAQPASAMSDLPFHGGLREGSAGRLRLMRTRRKTDLARPGLLSRKHPRGRKPCAPASAFGACEEFCPPPSAVPRFSKFSSQQIRRRAQALSRGRSALAALSKARPHPAECGRRRGCPRCNPSDARAPPPRNAAGAIHMSWLKLSRDDPNHQAFRAGNGLNGRH